MKRLLLLTAALLLSGAALAQKGYERQRRDLFDVLPVRSNDIIFLGDGLTDGCEWAELFDNRHIKNRGIRGDRSEWLLERLDTLIAGHPKKLFLMIGTNDLAAGVAPARIVEHVRRLIDRFRTESRWTKLYVQSILPVNGRSFDRYAEHYARAAQIVETNRQLAALCEELQVVYLDVYAALVDSNGDLNAAYTDDGLHLLGEGYQVWKEAIRPYVK